MTNARTSEGEPVVVIGSGPSGAAAAERLVARGIDVLMLDSGSAAPRGLVVRAAGNTIYRKMGRSHYCDERIGPDSDPDVMWISSLSQGGLSNYWTAAVPRFAPEDFTEGGRLDQRFVWPVTYDDLVPYYKRAEEQLTVTAGPAILGVPPGTSAHDVRLPADWQLVAEQAQQSGHGVGALPMAKGHPWMVARRGTEFSSYHCIVQPLEPSPRFELRRNAHASRITWSAGRGRVNGVEYVDRSTNRTERVPARAVVVAAGTVDSTMLLLRSTSDDFPTGLGNSSGVIGRYLHDHPREWWRATMQRPMRAPAHPIYLARTDHSASDPLMATSHTIGLAAPIQRLRTYVRGRTESVGVQVFGTMIPDPDFEISIADADTNDPVSQRPTIRLRYDDRAVENIESSRDRLRDVLGHAGLDIAVPGPFHRLEPGSSVHLAGTVRMHDDPRHGALDGSNRMHDVPNVVVCDMSCFPTNPEKNPTLTAMALAIRAADRLADDLG